jgi:hypothetical protein
LLQDRVLQPPGKPSGAHQGFSEQDSAALTAPAG